MFKDKMSGLHNPHFEKKKCGVFMSRSKYSLVLVGGDNIVQVIDLYTTFRQVNKAFYSLSFAMACSDYDELYLYSGESQINKATLKK